MMTHRDYLDGRPIQLEGVYDFPEQLQKKILIFWQSDVNKLQAMRLDICEELLTKGTITKKERSILLTTMIL